MATKKKEDEGVDIFASAKSKTKSSSAKSDKTVVEVKGLEKKLLEHQWLSGEQANLKTQIDVVKNELKQIGLEKYVELYKKNKSNPNTFLIQDGKGCVMFMPTDGYIKIKEESRAEELIEKYGEDAVTIKEEYSFNSLYLERNLEAIKKLIKETKTISEEDKRNLIERTVEYSISKGTIDKLYQYGSKMASVLDDIQPIIALKNCGGKMEKGGNTDDLIGYVYEGEDADEKIIKKVDLYAKGSTVEGELYRLYDVQDDNFKEIIGSLSQINDFLDEQGENGNYDKWVEGATFSNADKYGLYLEKIGKYAKGSTVKGEQQGYYIKPNLELRNEKFPYLVVGKEGAILFKAENKKEAELWVNERIQYAKGSTIDGGVGRFRKLSSKLGISKNKYEKGEYVDDNLLEKDGYETGYSNGLVTTFVNKENGNRIVVSFLPSYVDWKVGNSLAYLKVLMVSKDKNEIDDYLEEIDYGRKLVRSKEDYESALKSGHSVENKYAKGSTIKGEEQYNLWKVGGRGGDRKAEKLKTGTRSELKRFVNRIVKLDNVKRDKDREYNGKFGLTMFGLKLTEEQVANYESDHNATFQYANGGGVAELKVGDKVELRMGGDSKRGVVVSPPSNGKVLVDIEFTDVLSKRTTKMKMAFPVSSIHKLSTMAKGGGVKHKTEEEIYEEEQYNAMFNSEYGKGGNIGDFSEDEILLIQKKVEKGGQKVAISKEEWYGDDEELRDSDYDEEGGLSYGINFEENSMWYGDDKELRDSDYDKLSQLLTFNSSKYSYGKYAKGGNMSSGYDYSIGGL